MIKKRSGLFWGVVVGAIGAAIAGAVALLKSFQTREIGAASREALPKAGTRPAGAGGKTAGKKMIRRRAAKK